MNILIIVMLTIDIALKFNEQFRVRIFKKLPTKRVIHNPARPQIARNMQTQNQRPQNRNARRV